MAKSLLVLVLLSVLAVLVRSDEVHELLPTYGLPAGLLPDAVKSYTLSDDGSGSFEVELSCSCYVHFPTNLVYYEKTVKGKLSYGQISDLSGIQAKKLFVWVSVTGIVAHPDRDSVEFQVGFISESLPLSQFQSIPPCGNSAVASPAVASQ